MDKTNLFYHSPKELSTDGFLTWLFYLLDSDDSTYGEAKQKFFDSLILKETDLHKAVKGVAVDRQASAGKEKMDILLSFEFASDSSSKRHYVLFEDKVSSTTNDRQLSDYKAFCERHYNMYDYIYLKLDYINMRERDIAVRNGYRVVSNKDLAAALAPIEGCHIIIEHYLQFLKGAFLVDGDSIQERIDGCADGMVFANANVQKYYIEQVLAALNNDGLNVPTSQINPGTSFGRPWVELWLPDGVQSVAEYGGEKEALFWRIDQRSDLWHIRLCQYCWKVDAHRRERAARLNALRSAVKNVLNRNHPDLRLSQLSNKGEKNSDVIVLSFVDNAPQAILDSISDLTKSVLEIFKQLG